MVIEIVVAIGVGIATAAIGMWQFYKVYNKTSKTESAKFIFELNKRFLEEPFREISRRIGESLEKKEPFEIKDDNDERKLVNYLSELEVISQFYLDEVLTKKQTYEVLGSQILEAYQIKVITDFIAKERKRPNCEDLYDNLERTWKDLEAYQKKKFENS